GDPRGRAQRRLPPAAPAEPLHARPRGSGAPSEPARGGVRRRCPELTELRGQAD
ncbi:unnamed protein product, partial [Durusdinium trenchii]